MEALPFLANAQLEESTWIIPAVPIHVACQWILLKLNESGHASPVPVPPVVDEQVPNPLRTPGGTLYTSYATFRCPDSCSEPDAICTQTGKPRQGSLFDTIARIAAPPFLVTVVRSRQLAPGVGGYTAGHLREALKRVEEAPQDLHLIATSCRCHGVIDGLQRS